MTLIRVEFNEDASEAITSLAKNKGITIEQLVDQWIESVKQEVKNGEWEKLAGW